jgi:hypothetical protein
LRQLEPVGALVAHAALRDIELVQNVEGGEHGIGASRGRHIGLRKDDSAHEARWRGEIARQPMQAGALTELRKLGAVKLQRRHVGHAEIDVIAEIGDVPIVSGRVGHDAEPGSVPLMVVPAGITTTVEASGKPNSIVRPLIMAPSAASRLMPVQAWACVVAKVKAAVSAATAVLRNIGRSLLERKRRRLFQENREGSLKQRSVAARRA